MTVMTNLPEGLFTETLTRFAYAHIESLWATLPSTEYDPGKVDEWNRELARPIMAILGDELNLAIEDRSGERMRSRIIAYALERHTTYLHDVGYDL